MFEKYTEFIKNGSFSLSQDYLQDELLIEQSGDLSVFYAPFDYINFEAKIVICGITPGKQQSIMALQEACKKLNSGATKLETLRSVKTSASFGGSMRLNLIKLLDFIGLPENLKIKSSSELFGSQSGIVHYTSALRYPVFISLDNYSGSPSMLSNSFLRKQLEQNLLPELSKLGTSTIYIPLGPKVEEALIFSANEGVIREEQILAGLPHPAGTNSERIAYFLKNKPKNQLSSKTNAKKIDASREKILATIASM